MKKSKQEIKNRILSFSKKRAYDKSLSASEVTKDLFTDVWKNYVDDVRTVAGELQNSKLVRMAKHQKEMHLDNKKRSVRISLVDSNK